MSSDSSEIIYVCQIPECGYQADTWDKDGLDYYYCPDHAAELGWCVECHQYVTPDGIYTYDMCADCLEAAPEDYAAIGEAIVRAIDDLLAGPQCPHCGSIDITEAATGGGYCHACDQMFDAVKGDS